MAGYIALLLINEAPFPCARGKVAEFLAEDAAEVQFGQVLFQIKRIA